MTPLTRQQAEELVQPYIDNELGYPLISADYALEILGQERFDRLTADKIRGVQPFTAVGYFYSWNVIDYLVCPNLNKSKETAQ